MTTPAPSSTGAGLTPLQKIAATSAVVAAASGALGAGITRSLDSGAVHFPRCSDVQNVTRIRGLKLHTARLAGDSTFIVPIAIDSSGTPSLDLRHRQLVTDSALATLCTVAHDSLAQLPPLDTTSQLIINVDSIGSALLNHQITQAQADSLRAARGDTTTHTSP